MKIIQISDLHLADDGESAFELNNYQRLESVIVDAMKYRPDLWVYTGDICLYEPHRTAYEFLKNMIESFNQNAEVIAGNHDDSKMMTEIIYGKTQTRYYKHESMRNLDVIYLDTYDAEITAEQMALFRNISLSSKPLLVFMHHPPILCGVPYMDNNYPFSDEAGREKFMRLIESTGRTCHIFCGHYHNVRTLSDKNWHVHICPAVHAHIDDRSRKFEVLHTQPGYRVIEIRDDKSVVTFSRLILNN